MNNTQFYLTLGVPFFTLLLVYVTSVISNRSAINDLRSEMRSGFEAIRSEMRGGFDSMNERIGRIEQKQDALDTEIRSKHDHRLTVLEERVLGSAR